MSAPLAAVLAFALPASAGTARVELAGELTAGAPAPRVAPQVQLGGLTALPALAPSLAAPVAFAAPPIAAPAAPSGVAGFATTAAGANAPASQAPGAARPLLATLAAPALQVKDLGTSESAGGAERDFAARAQLDAPRAREGGAGATFAPAFGGAFRPLAAASKSAARSAAPVSAAEPATLEDRDGKRMEDALARADAAKGEPVNLGFVPSPKSLRVMAERTANSCSGAAATTGAGGWPAAGRRWR